MNKRRFVTALVCAYGAFRIWLDGYGNGIVDSDRRVLSSLKNDKDLYLFNERKGVVKYRIKGEKVEDA